MKVIAKTSFSLNGVIYNNGDEVKVDDKEKLVKLNELGYIEPLSAKDIQNFGKEEKPKKEYKKSDKEEE